MGKRKKRKKRKDKFSGLLTKEELKYFEKTYKGKGDIDGGNNGRN